MKKDAIIVLGGGENEDGSLPKQSKLRVIDGIKEFRKTHAESIIFTGRQGLFKICKLPETEAKAMKKYAISKGFPKNKIITEDKSGETIGNAYYSKKIIDKKNYKNLMIVTSDYHIPRTEYIFKKIFKKDYNLTFFSSPSHISKRELKIKMEAEKKSMEFGKKILRLSRFFSLCLILVLSDILSRIYVYFKE